MPEEASAKQAGAVAVVEHAEGAADLHGAEQTFFEGGDGSGPVEVFG